MATMIQKSTKRRPGKGFRAPWVPVYRIVGMLEEVGGFFVD